MKTHEINQDITASKVLLVGDGDPVEMGLNEALQQAYDQELDLVKVSDSGNKAVCKIMDYSKLRFEMQKADRLQRKKQREQIIKTKEIKIKIAIKDNDLKTKASKIDEFLEDNNNVKITIRYVDRYDDEYCDNLTDKILGFVTHEFFKDQPSRSGKDYTTIIKPKRD